MPIMETGYNGLFMMTLTYAPFPSMRLEDICFRAPAMSMKGECAADMAILLICQLMHLPRMNPFWNYMKQLSREIVHYFQPDVIVSQNGADAHMFDPLTHLCGSMKIYERIPELAHELAHEYCDGRWIGLGGGGYDIWRVVPRAWGQIWNVMKTDTVAVGPLPKQFLEKWQKEAPSALPAEWQDNEAVFPVIPRKADIEEKNRILLQQLLNIIQI